MRSKIEELLGTVPSIWFVLRLYNYSLWACDSDGE